jgi:hypothetical protein
VLPVLLSQKSTDTYPVAPLDAVGSPVSRCGTQRRLYETKCRYATSYDQLDGGAASEALGFPELRHQLLQQVRLPCGPSFSRLERNLLRNGHDRVICCSEAHFTTCWSRQRVLAWWCGSVLCAAHQYFSDLALQHSCVVVPFAIVSLSNRHRGKCWK